MTYNNGNKLYRSMFMNGDDSKSLDIITLLILHQTFLKETLVFQWYNLICVMLVMSKDNDSRRY